MCIRMHDDVYEIVPFSLLLLLLLLHTNVVYEMYFVYVQYPRI